MENTEKWRKLVAKSSVVPQRPHGSGIDDDDDDDDDDDFFFLLSQPVRLFSDLFVQCAHDRPVQIAATLYLRFQNFPPGLHLLGLIVPHGKTAQPENIHSEGSSTLLRL